LQKKLFNTSCKHKLKRQPTVDITRQLNNHNGLQELWTRTPRCNSTYPKVGVSCFKGNLVANGRL